MPVGLHVKVNRSICRRVAVGVRGEIYIWYHFVMVDGVHWFDTLTDVGSAMSAIHLMHMRAPGTGRSTLQWMSMISTSTA